MPTLQDATPLRLKLECLQQAEHKTANSFFDGV